MRALARPRNPMSCRLPTRSMPLAALVAVSILVLSTGRAIGQSCTGCNTTGAWTHHNDSGADWGYQQIHLALLRGTGAYHSYIVGWQQTGDGPNGKSGLHGWKPGDPGWTTYPSQYLTKLSSLPETNVNLFCAGHSTLKDGRLLISGGHVGHDIGIVDARIFDPTTQTWSTPNDTMHYPRWYGTNTTLPSGKVLTTSGSRYYKTLTFGGSPNLGDPSASIDDVRPGHLTSPNIIWETPLAEIGPWPSAREGHSAAWLKEAHRMVVFGGRNAAGELLNDTWILEYKQEDAEPYVYSWTLVTGGPGFRYGHVAIGGWDHKTMIAYGGKDQTGVTGTVHRIAQNAFGDWVWSSLTQSGPSPGARWGHAAAWDDQNERVIVFGGRTQTGFANILVYDLKIIDNVATWREITPSGTGPSQREGHSIVWDTEEYSRPGLGSQWRRVILFGGKDSGGARKNDAWILWYRNSDQTNMQWEVVSGGPTAPPPRTRHSSFWDFSRLRMVVIGGDTGASTSDNDNWGLATPTYGDPSLNWVQEPDHIPGLAGQTVVSAGIDFVAQPEVFDPDVSGGQYGDAFDRKLQPYYPAMFVLPSGNLLYAAPNHWTQILNPNTGTWYAIDGTDRDFYGDASAMYRPGKVVKAGFDPAGTPNQKKTAKLELGGSDQTAGWVAGEEMGVERHHHNLTILPNGKVLVTGGEAADGKKPEIWDPDAAPSNWWSGFGVLAPNPAIREYHSTALLLPDGRVLTAGGIGGNGVDQKVTIFCPPYLFDGSGGFATRPVIEEAPCVVGYGSTNTFEVQTSDIGGMVLGGTVALIRPGAVTHAFDENQRYVPLSFTVCGNRLRVQAPASENIAPPGDYLLFLVNGSGVPSVARWLRVGSSLPAGCDGVVPSQATGPTIELISENQFWMYWNAAADDVPSTGTVAAYEVRRSNQSIGSETAFCAAVVASGQGDPPAPLAPPTGYQYWSVTGLSPNTTYHIALKARDESWNWGPVSASVSETTLPPPGGGGGGFRASRVFDDVSARPRDTKVAENGSAQTEGREDVVATLGEGQPLVVEVQPRAGGVVWTIQHLDAAAAAELTGTDGASIVAQDLGADGAWLTRGRFRPDRGSTRFAVKSAARPTRYVFLGQVELQLVPDLVGAADGSVWELAEARHSVLGNVTGTVRAAGGYDMGLVPGEILTMTYASRAAREEPVAGWFALVSPAGSSAGLANRRRIETSEEPRLPTSFALHQNHPNPFRRATTIVFDLPAESDVRLTVFDAQGRQVKTLAAGRHPAGSHAVAWDGRDDGGRPALSGVYLYRLEAGAFRARRKTVLLP